MEGSFSFAWASAWSLNSNNIKSFLISNTVEQKVRIESEDLPIACLLSHQNKCCICEVHWLVVIFFHQLQQTNVILLLNFVNHKQFFQKQLPQLFLHRPSAPVRRQIHGYHQARPGWEERRGKLHYYASVGFVLKLGAIDQTEQNTCIAKNHSFYR